MLYSLNPGQPSARESRRTPLVLLAGADVTRSVTGISRDIHLRSSSPIGSAAVPPPMHPNTDAVCREVQQDPLPPL